MARKRKDNSEKRHRLEISDPAFINARVEKSLKKSVVALAKERNTTVNALVGEALGKLVG